MNQLNAPIIIEKAFQNPLAQVWAALTQADLMQQWYFKEITAFEATPGFKTQFDIISNGRLFRHLWKITEVNPPKKIVCRWRFEGLTGEGFVHFELFEKGKKTLLRLTNTGLGSFPQELPEFSRESCTAGWNYFIGESLTAFLEKTR